mmetsp:Transcript_197/g.409  ORF Transcript_197/g.409 Transcript_197/m.409 type:complete len:441 (-) Transcript_197:330-1652(-)
MVDYPLSRKKRQRQMMNDGSLRSSQRRNTNENGLPSAAILLQCLLQFLLVVVVGSMVTMMNLQYVESFGPTGTGTATKQMKNHVSKRVKVMRMAGDDWSDDDAFDSNRWRSSDDDDSDASSSSSKGQGDDWEDVLKSKADGSFWSSFEPSPEEEADKEFSTELKADDGIQDLEDDAEAWLSTLASISAEEVEFNMAEADRADKVRQMQEWGFDDVVIKNTFGVEVDDSLESKDEVNGMQDYRNTMYIEDDDLKEVESHTKVQKDPETGEPIRQQMVYVDEHTCIGCTNCAMIAQSTFFMDDEHGRARVFQQWGDSEETIQVAIETCPVDCIHYVPYDELVRLEKDRRGQNINAKARLVNQGEYAHMAGGTGSSGFTAPQKISGNAGSRCNNCPSRGCKTCPMFGVGKNPEYERKERERKDRIERNRLKRQREEESKSVDL